MGLSLLLPQVERLGDVPKRLLVLGSTNMLAEGPNALGAILGDVVVGASVRFWTILGDSVRFCAILGGWV